MARIIIDKAALEAGEPAVQVIEPDGTRTNFRKVKVYDAASIQQYDTPQQDGTRIEINCHRWSGYA